MSRSICARRSKFLSTPSARRATLYNHRHAHCCQISIHALREEGDDHANRCLHPCADFYPRPPRGGRPAAIAARRPLSNDFYPRPPRGGRPVIYQSLRQNQLISIHALREEGDTAGPYVVAGETDFYPRPPRGGRRLRLSDHAELSEFLSTPSARRATSSAFFMPQNHRFLSTPSARRATGWPCRALRPCSDFYPRPPRGGRLAAGACLDSDLRFLSTPSARRATSAANTPAATSAFLSTPSARRATCFS